MGRNTDSNPLRLQKLTNDDGEYFFGYYDLQPFNGSETYHLCHRVKFRDRLPSQRDIAQIGMVRLSDHTYVPLAETTAWNFQQGAMLQWHPKKPDDEVLFNIRTEEGFKGVSYHIHTGKREIFHHPIAAVDPTGTYALSVNFSRLYDFRPGYGYAGIPDRFKDELHPKEDGIFLINLQTGDSRLILSLDRIWELTRRHLIDQGVKMVINHITFNPDGTRFVFLVRHFPKRLRSWRPTLVMTACTNGTDLSCLTDYTLASHYHWKDPSNLLIYLRDQLYVLSDKSGTERAVDTRYFSEDGHCSYSPDRNWILYDSYPDSAHRRHLYLYHTCKKAFFSLGRYASPPVVDNEIRCDLHPRWNRTGTGISFDSTHEGKRQMHYMDLKQLIDKHG